MASSEIWKDIKGYKNYQVSNLGRVRSKDRVIIRNDGETRHYKSKILTPQITKKGYLRVSLYNDNGIKSANIHRLVAFAFIENKSNLPQINHIDGNKKNNRVNNLEWCDNRYNQIHAISKGLRNIKPIIQYSKDNFIIKKWKSPILASKELGVDLSHILQVCKGQRVTAGGYKWKYEEGYYE